ncbi:MAG TPA: molybdopterin cofactor-binding domain-containing protein [Kofleriaceae bacterium]
MTREIAVSRRGFLAGLGAATAGLALGWRILDAGDAAADPAVVVAAAPVFAPNPFIQIGADGVVTIVCHRSEMGQGIRSSLPVLIADELGADPAKVRVVQGDADERYGDQNTDGSTSIRNFFEPMRQVAATAREMLVAAAAARWRVPAARLTTHDDAVHDPRTHRSLAFGALAEAAAALPVPKAAALRPQKELTHLGRELPLRDGDDFVTGKAAYAADVRVHGMLTAVIARPPSVFGKVARLDDHRARAVPGVRHVVPLPALAPPAGSQPLGGIAVVADHTFAAMRGRAALDLAWDAGPNGDYDSQRYTEQLLAAVRAPGETVRKLGDVDRALAGAARVVEAEYVVPHLTHAPMEPPAALARIDGDRCEVWTCTQDPQDAQEAVAKALGIPKPNVTVHVTFLGGGFGRKSIPDYAIEAALLAKATGVPVRVQWSREDEIRHGYYHTHSAQSLAAGLDAGGNVVAWRQRMAFPSISATFAPDKAHPSLGELSQGIIDLPLAIPNVLFQTGAAPQHIRIGWMRSVNNVQHAFAVQSFIAELAAATRRDPRDMLLAVLGPKRALTAEDQGVEKLTNYGAPLTKHPIDVGRFHRVIDRVTQAAGWDTAQRSGRALGLAVHRSFLSYIAVVAQVGKGPRGEPRVEEAWIAADAGTIVNADRVRAQLEGAFVFGMTTALHAAITVKRGAVEQSNFRDYPLTRIGEAPRRIHIDLVPSDGPPGGIGEPGVPPVAPAILNAVFALTGERVRTLPLWRAPVVAG